MEPSYQILKNEKGKGGWSRVTNRLQNFAGSAIHQNDGDLQTI